MKSPESSLEVINYDNFSQDSPVTVVLTSCGRPDLLIRTLNSFFKYNTYPLRKFIITEDSGLPDINKEIKQLYPKLIYIEGPQRIGQIASIDRAYKLVDTPYIFHLEDDWEFYKSGFIEESLKILEAEGKSVSAVMCRSHENFQSDIRPPFVLYWKKQWGYYSFNPGLRRLSDYQEICQGSFQKVALFRKNQALKAELRINDLFKEKGYRLAITPDKEGYVRHIGQECHVK